MVPLIKYQQKGILVSLIKYQTELGYDTIKNQVSTEWGHGSINNQVSTEYGHGRINNHVST
jgi:hypothetical protein